MAFRIPFFSKPQPIKQPRKRRTKAQKAADEAKAIEAEISQRVRLAELNRKLRRLENGEDDGDGIEALKARAKEMKELEGLFGGGKRGKSDDGAMDKLVELLGTPGGEKLAEAIGPQIGAILGGLGGMVGNNNTQPQDESAANEDPRMLASGQPSSQQPTPKRPVTVGEQFVAVLSNKTPEQAAEELMSAAGNNENVKAFIGRLCECETPEQQAIYLRQEVLANEPGMAAFVNYVATHGPWFAAIVEQLRAYQDNNRGGPGRTGL